MTTQPWEAAWINDAVAEVRAGISPGLLPNGPIVIQPCVELLDISQHRLEETRAFALQQADAPESEPLGPMGYAPHAPYTASLKMTQMAAARSRLEHRLVTMHLAESMDELEWLENRKGSFSELLGSIVSDTYFEELGQISEHVQTLTNAWRATIAHGNYLSQNDLCNLAAHSKSMAIVHCPRTHAHFGHRHGTNQVYPLADRMSSGIRHFLGTDSRASNPDLNLWNEAQRVRTEHPSIACAEILKMITTDAAEFLGIVNRHGAIRVNQPATLTAIKLPANIPRPSPLANTHQIYDDVLLPETVSTPLEMVLRRAAV
jgi:cytosine/adenosine deaminase-related metal-dependent hydrolase